MMRIPPATPASCSRRISRALRRAMETVAMGLSFVPGLLSEPFGEIEISAACIAMASEQKQKRITVAFQFIEKPILHMLYWLQNFSSHRVGRWHRVNVQ